MRVVEPLPGELHHAACDVLTRLERLDAGWRFGLMPPAADVDAVAAAVGALHARLERTAGDADGDRLAELVATREVLRRAARLAARFLDLAQRGVR